MKFDFKKREMLKYQKQKRIANWHPWFAWYPVSTGEHQVRWLEKVERRRVSDWFGGSWEYRAVG